VADGRHELSEGPKAGPEEWDGVLLAGPGAAGMRRSPAPVTTGPDSSARRTRAQARLKNLPAGSPLRQVRVDPGASECAEPTVSPRSGSAKIRPF